ncbi:MAG TPA: DegQ family serine endoprotease [Devosiaceae bacterium]
MRIRGVVIALLLVFAALPISAEAQAQRRLPQNAADMQISFASVVKQAAPAVVNVYATRVTQQRMSPLFADPFFQQFFGNQGPMFQGRPQKSQSLGSGVIVDPSGIIITNHHVVNGATDVRVSLSDGREYQVNVVVDDASTDLAVLKIEKPGGRRFPTLQFGNSDQLEVGDLVLAIGNPFGVGQTVTSGIVSALARTGVEASNYEFFIQTDAAINPGNSGGALVDMQGRLVGINTAIFTQNGGGSIGIGFAIPANMARVVAKAAQNGGKIVRPWFGAQLQDVTQDLARGLGLNSAQGALIAEVAPGSPADRAGLRSGDVIVAIDGVDVPDSSAFNFRFATQDVGGRATVAFVRQGRRATAEVSVEPAPGGQSRSVTISGNTRFEGAKAAELTPALAQDLGLDFNAKGVAIIDVAPGSAADQLGLRKGDIILNLNGQAIRDVDTFKSIASTRPRGWQITLQRNNQVIRSFVSG